jgi:hypothetical protein
LTRRSDKFFGFALPRPSARCSPAPKSRTTTSWVPTERRLSSCFVHATRHKTSGCRDSNSDIGPGEREEPLYHNIADWRPGGKIKRVLWRGYLLCFTKNRYRIGYWGARRIGNWSRQGIRQAIARPLLPGARKGDGDSQRAKVRQPDLTTLPIRGNLGCTQDQTAAFLDCLTKSTAHSRA